jgi:glycine hydroxymethyltransferase
MQLDVDETRRILLRERPKTCLFGLSLFLFPFPLVELSDTLQEIGAKGWYDGAHVLGLIGGHKFQDPLHEGCAVLSGSTHKTLPGPQHGILLAETDDAELKKHLTSAAFPGVTSNHHLNAMAALAVSLAEHLQFGRDYARVTVANAQALASALHDRGFDVLCPDKGFTQSHQVAVRVAREGGGEQVAKSLESARFVVNKNLLPGDKSPKNPEGIRLGTQELTRVGMGPSEMDAIAELMHQFLHVGKRASDIAAEVEELKRPFTKLQFCFAAGEAAYRYYDLVGDGAA